MSFLEDLFEGRSQHERHGYRGGHDHDDDHRDRDDHGRDPRRALADTRGPPGLL